MTSNIFDDDELIALLASDGVQQRNKALAFLFSEKSLRNKITSHLIKKGCSKEEAIDLFKDGLIALALSVQKGKFNTEQNLRAYLFGICNYLWLNFIKKKSLVYYKENVNPPENDLHNVVTKLILKDNQHILDEALSLLKDPCKEVLLLWAYGYNFKEIAAKVGYANEGVARKKKHFCLKNFKELVKCSPELFNKLKRLS